MKLKHRKGNELITYAMVAVCMSLIAFILMPKGDDTVNASKRDSDIAQVNAIAIAVRLYKSEIGNYPSNLNTLTSKNGGLGPWLPVMPKKDAWGTTNAGINGTGGISPYCYAFTTDGFAVWAIGKNKINNSGGSGTALPTAFNSDDYGVLLK